MNKKKFKKKILKLLIISGLFLNINNTFAINNINISNNIFNNIDYKTSAVSFFDWEKIKNFFSFSFAGKKSEQYKKEQKQKENTNNNNNNEETVQTLDKNLYKQSCNSLYFFNYPIFLNEKDKTNFIYLCKDKYEIVYDIDKLIPIYVNYKVDKYQSQKTDKEISETTYKYEKKVPKNLQKIPNKNFINLAAPNDFLYDKMGYEDTLTYLNTLEVYPYTKKLWSDLEIWTKSRLKIIDLMNVNKGVLFLDKNNPKKITHLYQILTEPTLAEALVFIIPNDNVENIKGRNCEKEKCNIFSFTTNLKELEKIALIKYHPQLSDNHVIRYKISETIAYKKSN